jgi:GNAT superfamily N-acetyltransferase
MLSHPILSPQPSLPPLKNNAVLNILFVSPVYQRMGLGSSLTQWGTDLADRLFLPVYVEGSEFARGMYLKHGFEELEAVKTKVGRWELCYYMMRRKGVERFGVVGS